MREKVTLVEGRHYIIDAGFANASTVKLIRGGMHFCTVEDPETGIRWETMKYRLTEIKDEKTHNQIVH